MKQTVKAILPTSVLNQARKMRDTLDLALLSQQNFTAANLNSIDQIPLSNAYTDKNIESSWLKDKKAIEDVYGGEENLGGVNPGDRRALYYLIMALKPENILEVGTHIGASTLHIARALKNINKNGKVISADIIDVNHPETGSWKEIGLEKSPKEFARDLECLEYIQFHCGPCLDLMKKEDEVFDFIFLDGDHTASAVYKEVSAALKILKPNGVILLHDYFPEGKALYPDGNIINGPFKALQRINRENPQIQAHPLGELPWPTKQGTNLTSLALVIKS